VHGPDPELKLFEKEEKGNFGNVKASDAIHHREGI
jgi:hypothetical protein